MTPAQREEMLDWTVINGGIIGIDIVLAIQWYPSLVSLLFIVGALGMIVAEYATWRRLSR